MTTALSPDSRMLIHMICSRATQKVAWPISLQPLVTMPSQVAGSISCESEPTGFAFSSTRADLLDGPPQAGVIYKPKPRPAQRAKTPRGARPSADDFVAGKELSDFLLCRVGCVRAVYRIFADRFCVDLADRAGSRLGWIGRAHDLAIARDGILSFEHLHDHRSGRHELDELTEKRPFAMHRVEGFRLRAAKARAFLRNDAQARSLDHVVDRAGQIAGCGIGFDDRKGTLDRHCIVLQGRKRARGPVAAAYSERAEARQGVRQAVARNQSAV